MQVLCDGFEDHGHDLHNPINQAQQAALDVLVAVSHESLNHTEELNLRHDNHHPSEVLLEKQEEGQETLATNDNGVVFQQFHQRFQEVVLPKENFVDSWIRVGSHGQIKHCDECLLHPALALC